MKHLLPTLALIGACSAHAAVTLFTDEAAYLAAAGAGGLHIDFAGSPGTALSGASFSPAVTFGTCPDAASPASCASTVLHVNDAITDAGGSRTSPVDSLSWRFNQGNVLAFAFRYFGADIDAVNLVDTALHIATIDTTSASGFIGLVSDAPFFGGIGVNALAPGGGNARTFIDDFHISGPAQVPEPGTTWLGALAILGVAMARAARTTTARPAAWHHPQDAGTIHTRP